jgi:two-component sensor histidine kinase
MRDLDIHSGDKLLSVLPCVSYECTPSFEVAFLSENIFDLIGADRKTFLGNRTLWDNVVFPEDLPLLGKAMESLKEQIAASLIHRLVDVDGLPVWVCNRMQKVELKRGECVRGALLRIDYDHRIHGLDPSVGARFVHKLGNQFQLLGMILSSLRRSVPESKETEMLQNTLDKAAEVARAFSYLNQSPAWVHGLRILEIVEPIITAHRAASSEKGVSFKEQLSPAFREVEVSGDPFLLDLAIRHLLQNALEATERNGTVAFEGSVNRKGHRSTVGLRISDSGCGIRESDLMNATAPYFTTKKNHDGLGLSLAQRFVDMHNGNLRVRSVEGKGTQVEIILPAFR